MPLFSIANYFRLFFLLLFGILKVRKLTFCYLSTQLYETIECFYCSRVELRADCFSFTREKTHPEKPGSEGKCTVPPVPPRSKREEHRAQMSVRGYNFSLLWAPRYC